MEKSSLPVIQDYYKQTPLACAHFTPLSRASSLSQKQDSTLVSLPFLSFSYRPFPFHFSDIMQGLCLSHRLVTPATHRLCPVPVIGISTRTSSSTLSCVPKLNYVPSIRCCSQKNHSLSKSNVPCSVFHCLVVQKLRVTKKT